MKFKIFMSFIFVASLSLLTGCYEDKGNYDYSPEEVITVTFPERIDAMQGSEFIEFDPVVVSNLVGEIKDGNSDYEFGCKLMYDNYVDGKKLKWLDVNPEKTKAVRYQAKFPARYYPIWYTVTNKKSGVVHSFEATANVISATSNGWIVISNNGADKKVQVDMIYCDSKGNEVVNSDIRDNDSPDIYDARQIYMNATKIGNDQVFIWLCAGSGTYRLNNGTLLTDESMNAKVLEFTAYDVPGEVVWWYPVAIGSHGNNSCVCITSEGNAYGIYQFVFNAGFEDLMNTDSPGNAPTYKVAPVAASSEVRPGKSNGALFYDITNKRFMGFVFTNEYGDSEILHPLVHNSELGPQKFNYTTGMDFVHMEGTRFSDGVVYTVLQDKAAKRHIFGIQMVGSSFNQESYYGDIVAENFHTATDYAFHSQYPVVCYCKDNKLYCYNYVNNEVTDVVTLDSSERTTMVKFPLYRIFDLSRLPDQSADFMAKQYQVVLGSTTGGPDGGIIRFYEVDPFGKLKVKVTYTGLGEEPKDITYREYCS